MGYNKEANHRYYLKHREALYVAKQARRHRYKDKEKAYAKLYSENNKEKIALRSRRNRLKQFGITSEDYERILKHQNGVCAICWRKPGEGISRRFAVDHDHEMGTIRGLLCGPCNVALGHFKDDPTRLARAIIYLQEGI